ncbi:hypothetical protein [Nonomuraea recticatena]|uniref:hypothetical protein n=1 Tax=Nonomuraea recticatena TaxID=46178 RepID=UPI003616C143
MKARPAKGGGRWVAVPPERLQRWIDGFADRHGPFESTGDDHVVRLAAADGALAECHAPFPRCRRERRAWPPWSPTPAPSAWSAWCSSVSAVTRRASSMAAG